MLIFSTQCSYQSLRTLLKATIFLLYFANNFFLYIEPFPVGALIFGPSWLLIAFSDLRPDFSQSKMHCPRRRLPISWAYPAPFPFLLLRCVIVGLISKILNGLPALDRLPAPSFTIKSVCWSGNHWSGVICSRLPPLFLPSFLHSPQRLRSHVTFGEQRGQSLCLANRTVLMLRLLVISSFYEMFICLNAPLSWPLLSSW